MSVKWNSCGFMETCVNLSRSVLGGKVSSFGGLFTMLTSLMIQTIVIDPSPFHMYSCEVRHPIREPHSPHMHA
jgi:hypothetical protein